MEEVGHFSRHCPPLWESPGAQPGEPWRQGVCESGSPFTLGGGLREWITNLHWPGLSFSCAEILTRAPPHDLPRPPGVVAPELSATCRGGSQGKGWDAAPPPGKQALPHILRAPRLFPAASQLEEGPRATPLPDPRQAEPLPPQEVGAERRPR